LNATSNIVTKNTQTSAWLAVYTRPNFEKKVYQLFCDKQIESFLPLHKKLRIWSDRKKWIEEPLFKNYVFVKVGTGEYVKVLNTDGVVRFVGFQDGVAKIPDEQIQAVRMFVNYPTDIEIVDETFEPGDKVEIKNGFLMGLHGELVSYKGNQRVAVRIESIGKSILVDIAKSYLQKV
jgi:transcriptional antiterminator RfaH